LSCRAPPSGAGGGASSFSRCATHFRCRYTPAVSIASRQATAADQRAYLAASLLFMPSVKQNFGRLYTKATTPSALRNQRRRETQCGTYPLPLVLDSETGR